MLSSRVFAFSTLLVALLCIVLSANAAPLGSSAILKRHRLKELETDSIPVSSDGDGLDQYNEKDEVPEKVKEEGNSSQGDKPEDEVF